MDIVQLSIQYPSIKSAQNNFFIGIHVYRKFINGDASAIFTALAR